VSEVNLIERLKQKRQINAEFFGIVSLYSNQVNSLLSAAEMMMATLQDYIDGNVPDDPRTNGVPAKETLTRVKELLK